MNPLLSKYSRLGNTVYADSHTDTAGNGSINEPFKLLQDAIDYAQTFGPEERKVILIAPGSTFDEDIIITGGIMEIMGLGPWNLGNGLSVDPLDPFGSTVPRSLTYNQNGLLTNGKWPSLVIGTIMDDEASSTHTAYLNACTISGDFTFNAGGISHNLQLRNVKIKGDYTSSGVGGIQGYFRRCYFDNFFTGTNTFLNIVDSCQFDKLVTVGSHSRIWQCEFRDGMTTGQLTSPLPPNGMYQTSFDGEFTGPVGSLLLDPQSNYWFNVNLATLGGDATRVLIYDLTNPPPVVVPPPVTLTPTSTVFSNTQDASFVFPSNETDLSVSTWVKLSPLDGTQQIFCLDCGGIPFDLYYDGSYKVRYKGAVASYTFPITNDWHHIVAVYDAGNANIDLFFDGNFVSTQGLAGGNAPFPIAAGGIFTIGYDTVSPSFRLLGKIANMEIWGNALTLLDSINLHSAGYYQDPETILPVPTLIGHYLMGDNPADASGLTITDEKGTADAVYNLAITYDTVDLPV